MKNKQDEALKVFKHVAKVNKRKLDDELWSQFIESESVINLFEYFNLKIYFKTCLSEKRKTQGRTPSSYIQIAFSCNHCFTIFYSLVRNFQLKKNSIHLLLLMKDW